MTPVFYLNSQGVLIVFWCQGGFLKGALKETGPLFGGNAGGSKCAIREMIQLAVASVALGT